MKWIVRTRRLIKHLPHLWRNGRTPSVSKVRVRDHVWTRLLLEHQIRYSDHELTPRQYDRLQRLAEQRDAISVRSLLRNFRRQSDKDQDYILERVRQMNRWERIHPGQPPTADIYAQFEAEARRHVDAWHVVQHCVAPVGQVQWDALYDKLSVKDREELMAMADLTKQRRDQDDNHEIKS